MTRRQANAEKARLQKIYDEEPLIEQFRVEICKNQEIREGTENLNWFDMSIGWFLAKGCNFEKAHYLGLKARYDFQYFQSVRE